jgi:hydrogenase maturation protein HypF
MVYKKIQLPFKIKRPVLALGSQAKNTVCFARNSSAYISRVHPDLSDPVDLANFQKDVKYFLNKKPKVIACDLHPEYQSTKYALQLAVRNPSLGYIQHHHAHIAACMAENGLRSQPVIGVAFDGTGLGADGRIWGAEYLVCNYRSYERAAHLKEIPLAGGERAVLEPWRLVAFWLDGKTPGIDKKKWRVLQAMRDKGINSLPASSMGRLFDAAGSLILGRREAKFEGELAIELQKLASACEPEAGNYKFKIVREKPGYIIDPRPLLKGILADIKARKPKELIARRFHVTVAEMISRMCVILRSEKGVNKVVLSGGVFQNSLLLNLSLGLLYTEGFSVFLHKELSPNDSCISLGQAIIAGL